MFSKESVLDELVEQVGILLNSINPRDELKKLITLEFTLNPESSEMEYDEVLGIVVNKLIDFYSCQKLEDLWTQYLLFESIEAIEDLEKAS